MARNKTRAAATRANALARLAADADHAEDVDCTGDQGGSTPDARLVAENQALRTALAQARQERDRAWERQGVTQEVLRAIASGAHDLAATLETLVEKAALLCGADNGFIGTVEGTTLRYHATYGIGEEERAFWLGRPLSLRPDGGGVADRVVAARAPVNIDDIGADPLLQRPTLRAPASATAPGWASRCYATER